MSFFQEYIETEGLATILSKVIWIQTMQWLHELTIATGAWACPIPPEQCMDGGSQAGHGKDSEHAPSRLGGLSLKHWKLLNGLPGDISDERVQGTRLQGAV